MSYPEVISLAVFQTRLKAQSVPREHMAFICPVCGTVQSATSLIRAGAGESFDAVEKFLGFSCVGRWTNAGPFRRGKPTGVGCDWTLGGLFHVHEIEVETDDGEHHPRFRVAAPEQAQHLRDELEPGATRKAQAS